LRDGREGGGWTSDRWAHRLSFITSPRPENHITFKYNKIFCCYFLAVSSLKPKSNIYSISFIWMELHDDNFVSLFIFYKNSVEYNKLMDYFDLCRVESRTTTTTQTISFILISLKLFQISLKLYPNPKALLLFYENKQTNKQHSYFGSVK
jgi:hypothetical protein